MPSLVNLSMHLAGIRPIMKALVAAGSNRRQAADMHNAFERRLQSHQHDY